MANKFYAFFDRGKVDSVHKSDGPVSNRYLGGASGIERLPVIVIPEGDWKRMVELSIDSQVGHRPAIGAEIKAIIERTEAANG